jgi:hypothetical protein
VDELDEAAEVVRVRVREHPVAEVEDVAGVAGGASQHVLGGCLDPLPRA